MDLKRKTVFVCGPTWGHIDMNKPALVEAGRRLRNRGISTVLMEVCDPKAERERYVTTRRNVNMLTGDYERGPMIDALVCLPKSEGSTECMLLRDVAIHCGIPIVSLEAALS